MDHMEKELDTDVLQRMMKEIATQEVLMEEFIIGLEMISKSNTDLIKEKDSFQL